MTHPYSSFEGSALWGTLNAAIGDLLENKDLEVMTVRQNVVGYLALKLTDAGWPSDRADLKGGVQNTP